MVVYLESPDFLYLCKAGLSCYKFESWQRGIWQEELDHPKAYAAGHEEWWAVEAYSRGDNRPRKGCPLTLTWFSCWRKWQRKQVALQWLEVPRKLRSRCLLLPFPLSQFYMYFCGSSLVVFFLVWCRRGCKEVRWLGEGFLSIAFPFKKY